MTLRFFLVTGPPAAGKTTVAKLLAERLEPGVHVEGDFFRRCIVSGRREMTPQPVDEALAQLRLRYRLAIQAADAYFAARFNVVLEDVIAGPVLDEVVAGIASRPLHVVVLLPSAEEIAARDGRRGGTAYADWDVETLHGGFTDGTTQLGLWLDTTGQAPDATVSRILADVAAARVAP